MIQLTERELRLLVADLAGGHVRAVPDEWMAEIRSLLGQAVAIGGETGAQAGGVIESLPESGEALVGDGHGLSYPRMEWPEVILSLLEARNPPSGPIVVVTVGERYRHPECPPDEARSAGDSTGVFELSAYVHGEDFAGSATAFKGYLEGQGRGVQFVDLQGVPLHRFPDLIQESDPGTVVFLDPRGGSMPEDFGLQLPEADRLFLETVRSALQTSLGSSEDPYYELDRIPSHLTALVAVIKSLREGQKLLIPYAEQDEFFGAQNELLRHLLLLRCDRIDVLGLPAFAHVISARGGTDVARIRTTEVKSWVDFFLRVRPIVSVTPIATGDGTENGISWFEGDWSLRFLPWLPDWLTAEGRPLFRGFEQFGRWTSLRQVVEPHYLFQDFAVEEGAAADGPGPGVVRVADEQYVEAVLGLRPLEPGVGPRWVVVSEGGREPVQLEGELLEDAFLVSSRHGACPMPDELAGSYAGEGLLDFYAVRPKGDLPTGLREWILDFFDSQFAREWIRLMEGRGDFNGVEDILSLPFPFPVDRQLEAYRQILRAEAAARGLADDLARERRSVWGAEPETAEWTRLISGAVKSTAALRLIGEEAGSIHAIQATAPFPIASGLRKVGNPLASPEETLEEIRWTGENLAAFLVAVSGIVLRPKGTPHALLTSMKSKLKRGLDFGSLRRTIAQTIPPLVAAERTGFLELIDWAELNQRLDPLHKFRNAVAHGRGPGEVASRREELEAALAEVIRCLTPICLIELLAVEDARNDPVSGQCLWVKARALRGDHPEGWPVRYEDVSHPVHPGSLYIRTPEGRFFPASPFLESHPDRPEEFGVLDRWDGDRAHFRSLMRRDAWESQAASSHLIHLLGE